MKYNIFTIREETTDTDIIKDVYENDCYKAFQFIKEGDIVVDVGAHIGSFTLKASSLKAKVFSYEPVGVNFNLLKKNVEDNNSSAKIYKLAIAASPAIREIYIRKRNFGGSSFYTPHQDQSYIEKVECIIPSKIFTDNNINRINFLKLDCEDSELEILENIDLFKIDFIAVEYVSNERRNNILKILKDFLIVSDKHNDVFGTIIFKKNG